MENRFKEPETINRINLGEESEIEKSAGEIWRAASKSYSHTKTSNNKIIYEQKTFYFIITGE